MKDKRIIKDFISFNFFLFLTLYIFKGLLKVSLRKNIIGDLGDPLLNLYILKHNIDRILTFNFKNFFDANIFYPCKLTLAFSENLISSSISLLPVYLVLKNIVVSYNIFVIANFVLSGFFMYLLCYHFTKNFFASLIAGTIFSFAPFKFSHSGHLHILTTMWLPLIFLFLHRFFEEKKYRFALLSSLFFIMHSLGCANYMVIISPFIPVIFLFYILRDKYFIKKYLTGFLIFIIVSGAILIPVYYHYLTVEELYGFKRSIRECIRYSPDVRAFLTAYPFTLTGKILTKFINPPLAWENTLYMGIIPVLSIIFICFFIIKKNVILFKLKKEVSNSKTLYLPHLEKIKITPPDFSVLYLVILLLSFILLAGPLFFRIKYLPNPVYYLFYYFFPGFEGLRVPSRFFIMFLFSSAVLLSHFYSLYFRKKTLIILEILILIEFVPYYVRVSEMPYKGGIPEVYKWLGEKKEKFAIMELPLEEARWWDVPYGQDKGFFYTYFSAYHNKKLFNGYSGYIAPLYNRAKALDLKRQIELAKAINIKYLIIHKDVYKENLHVFHKNMLENIVSIIENEYNQELVKVFEDDISVVYEIVVRNEKFDPERTYIKDYKFSVYFKMKDKKSGKLIFVYDEESPCILLYVNKIRIRYLDRGKLIYTRDISINPENHPFLLKGESFEREIRLPELKPGEYLLELEQGKNIIGCFKGYF